MRIDMGRKCLGAFAVCAAMMGGPRDCLATTLAANTEYDLNGSFKLYFHGINGAPSYAFQGTYTPGAELHVGAQQNNAIGAVDIAGKLNFAILALDATTGALGPQIGTASGSLLAGWGNIAYNPAEDVAAGIEHMVAGGALVADLHGTVASQQFDFTTVLAQTFASASVGQYSGVYDNLASSFGGNGGTGPAVFSLALGDTGKGVTDALFAWFYSANTEFLGQHFSINGDLNARYSQGGASVPEPMTGTLLGLGAISGLRARRRSRTPGLPH